MKRSWSPGGFYGKATLFIGLLSAVPLAVLPFYPEETRYALFFALPALLAVIIGALISLLPSHGKEDTLEWQSPLQRGSLPVLFAWCFGIFIGALPFAFSGELSMLHALFESASGWTTTGFTLVNAETLPHIFLFHRSFMQYCGGLGFILMMAALIRGKQTVYFYNAEGHPDRLMPSLRQTARAILLLYNGFLAAGTLFYRLFGMGFFEAVCHAMSALSTAGFSTKLGGIGAYGSLQIELVTIMLMIFGSTNFAVLLMLVKGRFSRISRISEVRFLGVLLLVCVPLMAFALARGAGLDALESVRHALFGAVTAFSTTGYSIMDYAAWPPFALGLLTVLMLIGGGIGSTAGGIKLSRAYLLLRFMRENIRKRLLPARNVTAIRYHRPQGRESIDATLFVEILGFVACFAGSIILGILLLTLTAECSLSGAAFEFISAFSTVGISNGIGGVHASAGTHIVLMAGMLLGRLEMYIVFIGLYSGARHFKRRTSVALLSIGGRSGKNERNG